MPPFRVEFYCPRQAPIWQPLTEGFIFKTLKIFPTLDDAQAACNGLVWQYHSARVIDASGNQCYFV